MFSQIILGKLVIVDTYLLQCTPSQLNYVFLFSDLDKFQEGIGEKIGMCVFFMTIFSANIVNAIYHGWQLTLVMMAPMPVSMI